MSETTEPAAAAQTRNRFDQALFAQSACNPIPMARYFAEHFKKVSSEQGGFDAARQDPALKLIIYQIWYLMGGSTIQRDWLALHDYCERHATHPNHKKPLVD